MRRAVNAVFVLSLAMAAVAPIPAQAQMYWRVDVGWSRPNDADFKDNETEKLIQDFGRGFSNTFSGATRDNAAVALMAGVGIPRRPLLADQPSR